MNHSNLTEIMTKRSDDRTQIAGKQEKLWSAVGDSIHFWLLVIYVSGVQSTESVHVVIPSSIAVSTAKLH